MTAVSSDLLALGYRYQMQLTFRSGPPLRTCHGAEQFSKGKLVVRDDEEVNLISNQQRHSASG